MKRKPGGGATRDIGRDVGIGLNLRKHCEKGDTIANAAVKKISPL